MIYLGIRDALCQYMQCIKKDTVINIWGEVGYNRTTSKYKTYKSSKPIYTDLSDGYNAAILKNGMFIGIIGSYQIWVDTNGSQGPNMMGMDTNVFQFLLNDEGKYRALPIGALGTSHPIPPWSCQPDSAWWAVQWPCTYMRMYQPEQML